MYFDYVISAMGEDHRRAFWQSDSEYESIVEQFDRGRTFEHPNCLTIQLSTEDWGTFTVHDSWMTSRVKYPSYCGPKLTNL